MSGGSPEQRFSPAARFAPRLELARGFFRSIHHEGCFDGKTALSH